MPYIVFSYLRARPHKPKQNTTKMNRDKETLIRQIETLTVDMLTYARNAERYAHPHKIYETAVLGHIEALQDALIELKIATKREIRN